jgi:hypothetical protein
MGINTHGREEVKNECSTCTNRVSILIEKTSDMNSFDRLLVPVVHVLPGAPELVPKAHADDIGDAGEHGGHLGEAVDPDVRVEVGVAEEAAAVGVAAAPPGLAQVVVQDDHQVVLAQAAHHGLHAHPIHNVTRLLGLVLRESETDRQTCLEGVDELEVDDPGVVDPDAGERLGEVEPLEGLRDGEVGVGGVGDQERGPREPDAVEPHGGHVRGDGADGPLAQPLRQHRLQVRRPVHARQLHPAPALVHHPPRRRRQRGRRAPVVATRQRRGQKNQGQARGVAERRTRTPHGKCDEGGTRSRAVDVEIYSRRRWAWTCVRTGILLLPMVKVKAWQQQLFGYNLCLKEGHCGE